MKKIIGIIRKILMIILVVALVVDGYYVICWCVADILGWDIFEKVINLLNIPWNNSLGNISVIVIIITIVLLIIIDEYILPDEK